MSCNRSMRSECAFLKEVITSFEKMLPFICGHEFGDTVSANIRFTASTSKQDEYVLNPLGSMMFIYTQVTSRTFPKIYTPDDINLINQIWDYLGHPENKIIL